MNEHLEVMEVTRSHNLIAICSEEDLCRELDGVSSLHLLHTHHLQWSNKQSTHTLTHSLTHTHTLMHACT